MLVQNGTGTLTLTGDSGAFAGTTVVSAGRLAVGDAADPGARLGGNVQVAGSGTLLGHGAVLGSIDNGGNVQPGGSIGTLSVAGNYAQQASGTLTIEGQSDFRVEARGNRDRDAERAAARPLRSGQL
ncbi:MAG: autotransporter-associated beta strand repeat-containing protein [Pararobbsia sp.]